MRNVLRMLSVLAIATVLLTTAATADDLPKLQIEKYTLSNGLDVILHQDKSIPMATVNVWYHVGSKNEMPGRTGFAHLFEHMMFQGSLNNDREFFEPIQKVGGVVNGSTNTDRTNYWENVPSNYLEMALWSESDRMGFLLDALTEEKLEGQRNVVMNERRERTDNTPYGRASEMILDMMYPEGHPYSWSVIGAMEDLAAAEMDDVKNFFRAYYTPSNASLCVAGDIDIEATKALVEKYFSSLPPGPPVEQIEVWVPKLDDVKRGVAEDDVEMARLYYVWHTPGYYQPGDAEFDLLASILGAGKTSRLYKTLVYDLQIAQGVGVYQASREMASTFHITVTAKPGHTLEEIEQIVDDELRLLLAEGITEEELKRAQVGWESGFVRRLQQPGGFGGVADQLNSYNTMLGSPDMLAWDMGRYTSPTVETVMAYAHKYIDLEKRGILHVVPHGGPKAAELAVDRSIEPGPMAEPTFAPPEIQEDHLDNGLRILLVEDHQLPLVQMNLVFKSGWTFDPAGQAGTANLTADLLNEGTKTRSALEISDDTRMLGAGIGTGSGFNSSSVSLNALKKNLDESMDLMADIVLNPTFPQEELDRLIELKRGQITQESVQPFSMGYKAFNKILYGADHPYAQPSTGSGTEESLDAITRDAIEDFYKTYYVPNNATVVIAGDLTMSEAKKKLGKVFGKWKEGTVVAENLAVPSAPAETRIFIVDKPGAEQSTVMIGHLGIEAGHEDATALGVLNRPLGGQFMSRINLNLREDKAYTYGARSQVVQRRGKAPFFASSNVEAEFTKESVFEMVKELTDVVGDRPLTHEELLDSKNSLIKSFPQAFQTLGGIAGNMQSLVEFDMPLDRWTTYVSRVNGIGASDVTRVGAQYIHPDAFVIVVVGDKEKIEAGLRELNLGPIADMN